MAPHWGNPTHVGLWPDDHMYRLFEAPWLDSSYDAKGREEAMRASITLVKFRDHRTHTTTPQSIRSGIYLYGRFRIPRALDSEFPRSYWGVASWQGESSNPAEKVEIFILWNAGSDPAVWEQIGRERRGGLNIRNARKERGHWVADHITTNDDLKLIDKKVEPASVDIGKRPIEDLYGHNRLTFRLMGLSAHWDSRRDSTEVTSLQFDPGDGTRRPADRFDDRGILGLYPVYYVLEQTEIPVWGEFVKFNPETDKTSVKARIVGVGGGGAEAWVAYAKHTKGNPTEITDATAEPRFPDRVETVFDTWGVWDDVPDDGSEPPPTAAEILAEIEAAAEAAAEAASKLTQKLLEEGGDIVGAAAGAAGKAVGKGLSGLGEGLLGEGGVGIALAAGAAVLVLIILK